MITLKHRLQKFSLSAIGVFAALLCSADTFAQDGARWYQIEVSIFSNEASDLSQEQWPSNNLELSFPRRLTRINQLSDSLQLSDWSVFFEPNANELPRTTQAISALQQLDALEQSRKPIGPRPFVSQDFFSLPDIDREAFLTLPPSEHDFQSTNRSLERSAAYRLLYHNIWRQVMWHENRDLAVGIKSGRQFGERSELEGSLRFYFNRSEDRVIFEPNLWLSDFSRTIDESMAIPLPPLPLELQNNAGEEPVNEFENYLAQRVIKLHQTRELRSNEFHYIDHPALGIVVQIFPYERPDDIQLEQALEQEQDQSLIDQP
ncbi:MAG: CsiV family protein [Pseudohongiellaceae bacterium]|nr:CsiV family protein [Pseudohongiellaceae bacterium]